MASICVIELLDTAALFFERNKCKWCLVNLFLFSNFSAKQKQKCKSWCFLRQSLFRSDVFADVRLVETDNPHGVRMSTFGRRFCRNAKTERQVRHGVDDNASVLFCVLGDSAKTTFGHIVPVQKLLLSSRFQPENKKIKNNDNK